MEGAAVAEDVVTALLAHQYVSESYDDTSGRAHYHSLRHSNVRQEEVSVDVLRFVCTECISWRPFRGALD